MDDFEKDHEQLLQSLIESVIKVFGSNSPTNVFIPPPIPITPTEQNTVTTPVTNTPQYQNSPPY